MAMKNEFLRRLNAVTVEDSHRSLIIASLQRNKTYRHGVSHLERANFRHQWLDLLLELAKPYTKTQSDESHVERIKHISDVMTTKHSNILEDKRFRIGTAQKSFNLLLKFQWCFGLIPEPPHCPVDKVILLEVKCYDSWTKNDCIKKYQSWIQRIKEAADKQNLSLAEWEYRKWLEIVSKK